jgi:hypothetical protein
MLVSETTPCPHPGSDEINRAYEEGWIGREGYLKPDGSRQRWALAFIGDTLSARGEKHPEIFVVDLPRNDEDYRQAGDKPLQGTPEMLPAPPAGVKQRRITFTENGIALQPRHWLRVSPDGAKIAFLMQDETGVVQVWTVSPNGGAPAQISHSESGIQSAFSWSQDGKSLALVCDNSVMRLDMESGKMQRLTQRSEIAPCADAVVYSPDGSKVAFMRQCNGYAQICVVDSD